PEVGFEEVIRAPSQSSLQTCWLTGNSDVMAAQAGARTQSRTTRTRGVHRQPSPLPDAPAARIVLVVPVQRPDLAPIPLRNAATSARPAARHRGKGVGGGGELQTQRGSPAQISIFHFVMLADFRGRIFTNENLFRVQAQMCTKESQDFFAM
ncbi:MAG: hypothetical protein WCA89_00025, partial [Terracidiphilus sp.]